jgi:photosystem II stability/assembly factor-like uncharacterized protein
MAGPFSRRILRIVLTLALAVLATTHARAEESEGRAALERESPPERVTIEHLTTLAAGAALRQPEALPLSGVGPGGLDWTFLGPRPITGDYWANGIVSGRVTCVAPHPTNANIVYVAGAQGGVWKTADGGTTWTVLTETLSSIASGWIAIDPVNPNTIWYGTGEQNYSGDSFYGDGLFRSTDAGTSWTKVATVSQVGSYIARVVVKPGDSNTIFVGSSSGFVRSTDGGATWASTLSVNWCDDIAVDPVTPTNVWASFNTKGVYKSTDGGANWTQTLSGPGRTNLAVSKTNPLDLFASLATGPGALYGAYKSSDGGATWSLLSGTPDYLNGQGWYDNTIVVSPTDTNTVLAGGTYPYSASAHGIVKTTNGGVSWTDVTKGVDNSLVHPDQHALAFGPTGVLWLGNDGGVWKTTDLGGHWVNCNNGLGIAQFYTVAAHPTNPNDIIGGTQDNGSVRFGGATSWPELISGDGGPVLYQRESPNFFYSSYVRMNPLYKWNSGSYVGTVTGGWPGAGDRVDWANGPLVEDPVRNGMLYVGSQRLWRSTDSGTTWSIFSSDLTGGSGVLRSFAVSPQDTNQMWAGSSDGLLHRSHDNGGSWVILTTGLAPVPIPDIAVSPADTGSAYVVSSTSSGPRVLHTSDGGATFVSVTGDLPVGLRTMSLAVDWRVTPERLYLGTDYGVYVSLNGGAHWIKANNGMPSLAVYDLAVDGFNSKLVAATHGRGMWRADLDITGPTLSLTSPVGGESWPVGATRTITWTASDPSGMGTVDLLLSIDGGASYPNTIASALPNTGSYLWTVAPGATTQARVRVVAHDALTNSSTKSSPANFTLSTSPTAVQDDAVAFGLDPVSPSPGRPPFAVRFGLPSAGAVTVDVYDLGGRRVTTLASGVFGAGRHALTWSGDDAKGSAAHDGVYFVRVRAAGQDVIRRVALVH